MVAEIFDLSGILDCSIRVKRGLYNPHFGNFEIVDFKRLIDVKNTSPMMVYRISSRLAACEVLGKLLVSEKK